MNTRQVDTPVHIAFFSEDQLESVVDLLYDMSAHYNGSNASDRESVKHNLVHNILGKDSGVRLIVASDAGRAIGLACISLLYPAPKERGQLFMKEIYVVSGRRDGGVGRAIMRFVAQYAIEKSCTRFDWTVDDTNPKAIEFYRALGATHVKGKVYFRFSEAQLLEFATNNRGSADSDGLPGAREAR